VMDVEHAWQISDHITNQLKFGFNRFGQPITSLTDGVSGDQATDLGITNLPAGQASTDFPGTSFATTTAVAAVQALVRANSVSMSRRPHQLK